MRMWFRYEGGRKPVLFLLMMLVLAGCTGDDTTVLPTLAVLSSAVPTQTSTSTVDIAVLTATPSAAVQAADASPGVTRTPRGTLTPTLVSTADLRVVYTTALTPLYRCARTTCPVATQFPAGVELLVIRTVAGWHEVQLARARGFYVEARLTSSTRPATVIAPTLDPLLFPTEPFILTPFSLTDDSPPTVVVPDFGTDIPNPPTERAPRVTPIPSETDFFPFTLEPTVTPDRNATLDPDDVTELPTPTFPPLPPEPTDPAGDNGDIPPGVDPNAPTVTPLLPP
jgi:hypothetical protein